MILALHVTRAHVSVSAFLFPPLLFVAPLSFELKESGVAPGSHY
jgi:hypothetical protein